MMTHYVLLAGRLFAYRTLHDTASRLEHDFHVYVMAHAVK